MSRKSSKNNRGGDKNKNMNKKDMYERQGNATNNGNETLSAVTFKYPGRFATLTRPILLNENLTLRELLRKVSLSITKQPPDGKSVYELYYMDEIYPFIGKHAQETINTKKEIGKSWDLQTNHFQKIYVGRAEILKIKWLEMKNMKNGGKKNEHNYNNYTVTNHHHHYQYHHHQKNVNGKENESSSDIVTTNSMTVIFKYYSVHSSAKTNRHIFITSPTKQELLNKIKLSIHHNPPTAKELFEIYYYDEILPFLKKSGQQSIRGKKDLSKLWQIQTKIFKNLYEDRAKILNEEWIRLKKEKNDNKKHHKKQRNADNINNNKNHKNNKKISKIIKGGKGDKNEMIKIEKIECSLIRTLLNFLLFVECTSKSECFMLLINDQNKRCDEYKKFKTYLKSKINDKIIDEKLCFFHIRVFIDNFDVESLRLYTMKNEIKLCFVNDFYFEGDHHKKTNKKKKEEEEELILFQLIFNKLISGLDQKIDHEKIEAVLDDETRILSINVPLI